MSFNITMKDQSVVFNDIIELSREQADIINEVAHTKEMSDWRNINPGVKIPLEQEQRDIVLAHKNSLVSSKDERALLKERTVIFTAHAKARVALRVDKVDPNRPPRLESLLLIIQLVVESDIVDESAEWKGHQNLVYTLVHTGHGERFKISVSFETIGEEYMKVITVSNEHIDELTETLANRPEIRAGLEALKARLLGNQQESKNNR